MNTEKSGRETHLGLDAGVQNMITTNEKQATALFVLYLSLLILFH